MRWKWMFIVPLAILGVLAFVAIGGLIVMLLWNWLMPTVFGLPQVGFWQACGLLALSRILFGGAGWHRGHRPRWSPQAKQRFRERFRARMHERLDLDESSSEGAER